MQCLPNTIGQTEVTEKTPDGITYTKSFSATPDINGIVINCTAKFNSTSDRPSPGQADNAPDVLLWNSAPLHVQCKQLFFIFLNILQTGIEDKLRHYFGFGPPARLGHCQSFLVFNYKYTVRQKLHHFIFAITL